MKYACNECLEVFDEMDADHFFEQVDVRPTDGYTYLKCPYCGCDDLSEAVLCDTCGDYFHPENVIEALGEHWCKDCAGEVVEAFIKHWAKIKAS